MKRVSVKRKWQCWEAVGFPKKHSWHKSKGTIYTHFESTVETGNSDYSPDYCPVATYLFNLIDRLVMQHRDSLFWLTGNNLASLQNIWNAFCTVFFALLSCSKDTWRKEKLTKRFSKADYHHWLMGVFLQKETKHQTVSGNIWSDLCLF